MSKRGWATWDIAATRCSSCVKILGIAPLSPIVPDVNAGLHRMWQAYGGYTWAFSDFTKVNFTEWVDTPGMVAFSKAIDPAEYYDRLKDIPKHFVLSGDDQFMMFDWTNIYYDKLGGEKHLFI